MREREIVYIQQNPCVLFLSYTTTREDTPDCNKLWIRPRDLLLLLIPIEVRTRQIQIYYEGECFKTVDYDIILQLYYTF